MRTQLIGPISSLIFLITLAPGCIVSDSSTSLYLSPDGGVHMVIYEDNVRSSEQGLKKKEEELQWLNSFKTKQSQQLQKLQKSGAKEVQSYLLKSTEPYSAIISAHFSKVTQLGTYFDFNSKGSKNRLEFTKHQKKRKLLIHLEEPLKNQKKEEKKKENPRYPTFKFVLENGILTETNGLLPSADKQSCYLDIGEIDQRLAQTGKTDLYFTWEVP